MSLNPSSEVFIVSTILHAYLIISNAQNLMILPQVIFEEVMKYTIPNIWTRFKQIFSLISNYSVMRKIVRRSSTEANYFWYWEDAR